LSIIGTTRASALVGVLVIMVILLTLFAAIYGYFYNRAREVTNEIGRVRALYLADAGVDAFVSTINKNHLLWKDIVSLELDEHISDSERYRVRATALGGYILIKSTGVIGRYEAAKRALIGHAPLNCMKAAVINYSKYHPLVLAGQTKITGDVIVKRGPVVRGSLEGKMSSTEEMVSGVVSVLPSINKPGIDEEFIYSYLLSLKEKSLIPTDSYAGSHNIRTLEIPTQSASVTCVVENDLSLDSLNLAESYNRITLIAGHNIYIKEGCRLAGYLEICAADSIILENNTIIRDAVLVANHVILKGKTSFRGQAISAGTIHVGPDSKIEYPSLLLIHGLNDAIVDRFLIFDSGSSAGTIAVVTENDSVPSSGTCTIVAENGSYLSGFVYGHRDSDLRGILHGTSLTGNYLVCHERVSYVNWLADAVIDRRKLDFFPVLPVLLPGENGYCVFCTYDDE
jgi:cytoskeletal protein CcmA (bactofilin family)